ncbi:MAG: DUF4179 domain-containing protein [Hespellia sp.]|nr:DUF4179 domain-containing protein [Hespellia sp.]
MSEKKQLDILREDIVIPEVVQKKVNDAFAQIHRNEQEKIYEQQGGITLPRRNRKRIGVMILAATLVLGSITAVAAALKWSQSFDKELHMTEQQKADAQKSGLSTFVEQPVSDAGVTITAQQSIVDNYYAFLSFRVEGYAVEKGEEPGFDRMTVTVDGKDVSYGANFYDGTIQAAGGKVVLADGSPIPLDENGNCISNYVMEDGTMEYNIYLSSNGEKGNLLNKPIHAEFEGLGTYMAKAGDIDIKIPGKWAFDWTLTGDDSTYSAQVKETLGDTNATVTGVEISPISIKAVYDFPRTEEEGTPDGSILYEEPPALAGVKLKDGTLWPYLYMGPGMSGYVDDNSNQYENRFAVDRILEVDQIESLLFWKTGVDLEDREPMEEDFYVVDIR